MKLSSILNWCSADVQALIEPPPIPIINVEEGEYKASNTIKINMRKNPESAVAETYKLKMATFKNIQPEEFLTLMRNFNIVINGMGNITVASRINDLRTILCGEALRDFDKLSSQNNGTVNAHLKHIQEGLLGHFL